MAKPTEELVPLFNPHYFENPFWVEFDTAPFRKESLLAPGLYFDNEFKERVLRYVPSIVPSIEGVVNAADFSKDMTLSEAYARTGGNLFTPRQFIAILMALLQHDRRKRRPESRFLRDDGTNVFCVYARGRTIAVQVEPGYSNNDFEGVGVHGFFEIKSLQEDDGDCEFAPNTRLFV